MISLVKILVLPLTQTFSAWGEGIFYLCTFFMSTLTVCGLGFTYHQAANGPGRHFAGKKSAAGAELPGLHLAEELLFWGGQGDCLGFAA